MSSKLPLTYWTGLHTLRHYFFPVDSPQPPELKPSELQYVMENTPVNLICSAEAPCPKQPPTISWSNIPESALITTQLQEKPDKTQSVFSNITFKASYKDHRKNISCTATYPRNTYNSTVKSTLMLQVLCKRCDCLFHLTEPCACLKVQCVVFSGI